MNEKGVSIAGVIAIMLILSFLGIVAVSLLGSSGIGGLEYLYSQKAFYIADAGRQWYLEQLQNDSSWSDNATSGDKGPKYFAGGSFTISVSNCQTDSIDFISTAALTGYEGQPVKRVVASTVSRGLPTAFNYALYVGGNIHTQGAEDFTITGQQKEGVEDFPTVNFSYYQSIANQVISGNYTFTAGTYTGIWYIDGNVTVSSNVTINGSIITTGNVDMKNKDNITITAASPYPALIAQGNLEFNNSEDITVTGLVYVGADLSGNFLTQSAENISFTGTVMVAGNFNAQNSDDFSITYDPSILENPPPGFAGGSTNISASLWKEVL